METLDFCPTKSQAGVDRSPGEQMAGQDRADSRLKLNAGSGGISAATRE